MATVYILSQPAAPELKRIERTQLAFSTCTRAFSAGRKMLAELYPVIENADGETEQLLQYAVNHIARWKDVQFFGINEDDNVIDSFTIHKLEIE